MSELFKDQQWVGAFFVPDKYDERFSGKIDYSLKDGVVLSYSMTGITVPPKTKIIYGVLDSGEKCTLLGDFSPPIFPTIKNGLISHIGKAGFQCLLLGDFFGEDELIFDINFSLTNLQEFFFPKGHKDLVKYSKKPLISIKTNFGRIEVGTNATFGVLQKDISSQIYSRNEEALNELIGSFTSINNKYTDVGFMLKEDIAYRISLKFDVGATIISAYDYIHNLSNLFALLIYAPVFPTSIQIKKKCTDGYSRNIMVYPSMLLNEKTINIGIENRSHFRMPITNSNIDLASTLIKWLESTNNYSIITSSIQSETGLIDEHEIYGMFVLYATQFEAISYDASVKEDKYEYPLKSYGTKKIRDAILNTFLAVGEKHIGKAIGDLRNEIAHIGRPKKLLGKLTLADMVFISQHLEITIIGYILGNLGMRKDVISEYQDKVAPDQ